VAEIDLLVHINGVLAAALNELSSLRSKQLAGFQKIELRQPVAKREFVGGLDPGRRGFSGGCSSTRGTRSIRRHDAILGEELPRGARGESFLNCDMIPNKVVVFQVG
jgi:hypothetical protein